MPWVLTSDLFKDNMRLQDCANDHRRHIALLRNPERGEHVWLIQQALTLLRHSDFDPKELQNRTYGLTTAKMVKRFKAQHKGGPILGPGQVAPDDVVGVQTIRRLDELMGGGNGGADDEPGEDNATAFTMSPKRVLRAQVFWLTSAKEGTGVSNPVPAYEEAAGAVLAKHNMSLKLSPGPLPLVTSLVAFSEELDDVTSGPAGTLFRARAAVGAVASGSICVIVGKFRTAFTRDGRSLSGFTPPAPSAQFPFAPTAFINSHSQSHDRMTLLHEMGRAAGADTGGKTQAEWNSEKMASNFMSSRAGSKVPRIVMMRWQGDRLADSFFGGKG